MSDTNTYALDVEYSRVIPARFVLKRDGTPMGCMSCGSSLVMGSAFAAKCDSGWHSYCALCAASFSAQIAGLVQRIEQVVTDLDPVPQPILDLVAALTPSIESSLGGTASESEMRSTKAALLALRASIGQAKAASQPAPVRSNAYGGKCGKCGVWIEPQGGRIEKQGGRWVTFHLDGACPAPQPVAATPTVELAFGLYLHDDGTVNKVYKTRNDRPAVKVLVTQETGEVNPDGTPKMRGSFQYVAGGIRTVAGAVLAGTAHALTQDEAAAFGRQFNFCVNCGLYLDDDRSLAAGYGPTCAKNNGWGYPNYEQAAAVLGRPAGPPSKLVEGMLNEQDEVEQVCEFCDEPLRPTLVHLSGSWVEAMVDPTGSETCSGEDASGPDYHHKTMV